jgi:hypothetical protein
LRESGHFDHKRHPEGQVFLGFLSGCFQKDQKNNPRLSPEDKRAGQKLLKKPEKQNTLKNQAVAKGPRLFPDQNP